MATSILRSANGRPRAGWRILLFVLLLMVLSAAGLVGGRMIRGSMPRGSDLALAIVAAAATVAVVLARHFIDRKSFVSLGLDWNRDAAKDLVCGFLLSLAMAGLAFGAMSAAGLVQNVQFRRLGLGTILALLWPYVLVGWWEEIVFRGYLLQNMIEGLGLRWAVVVSCLLYGAAHAANPNAGVLSTVIIMLFGFLRIYGYLSTRQLWLSIGMHVAWNFFQGPIFGYATSGQAASRTMFEHTASGPQWLTGGAFGPEASLLTIPVLGLALGAMWLWTRERTKVSAS